MIRSFSYAKPYKLRMVGMALFLIAVGILLMMFRFSIRERNAFDGYGSTTVTITSVQKYSVEDKTYAHITLEYHVDGLKYEAERNALYAGEKVGDTQKAYYNKMNPLHLTVKRNSPDKPLFIISIILIITSIPFFIYSRKLLSDYKRLIELGVPIECYVVDFVKDKRIRHRYRVSNIITVASENGTEYKSVNFFGYVPPDIKGCKCHTYLSPNGYFVNLEELC